MCAILRLGLLFAVVVVATSQSDYCKICSDHTLCKYPGKSSTCKFSPYNRAVSAADRDRIVDLHNQKRNTVARGQETRGSPGPQPAAANMYALVWDEELATIAQRWADQCTFGHDSCRNTKNGWVGQNVAMSYVSPYKTQQDGWDVPINMWYDEVKDMDRNGVAKYQFQSNTGHYTAVVWALTRRVGCGFSSYNDTSSAPFTPMLFVCNYAPGGNMQGQSIYQTGTARSGCPNSSTGRYPGLCY